MPDSSRELKQLDRVLGTKPGRGGLSLRPPVHDGAELGAIAEQLVGILDPESFAADQYRALRHSLELQRRGSELRILALTSPGPGDGKTVTTLNLAGTLAQGVDARVLIVDGDMRRPKVAEYLGLDNGGSPGLAELLQDPALDLSRAVRRIEGSNLSVLLAGKPRISPYELLSSPSLEALLMEACRVYDWVLVDTPPIVAVPDGRVIGKYVDGFVVVIGANKTPRKLAAEALALVDPAKIIGIVFNGDNRPLSSRYGYYGHYYRSANRHTSWWRRLLKLDRRAGPRSSR
jgi:capsular exopolysaccharide synthesis family protein